MIRLVTIASDAYRPLAAITSPSKEAYAERWGHYFHQDWHRVPDDIAWDRVERWQRHLCKCDWLFFTGADVAITNPDFDILSLLDSDADFIFSVSRDKALQNDVWFMRNNSRTYNYLSEVMKWRGVGDCQNEQDAMQIVFSRSMSHCGLRKQVDAGADIEELYNRSDIRCKIVPAKLINALPAEEYGNAEWEGSWKPGDFIVHLPNKSLEHRLAVFPKYL